MANVRIKVNKNLKMSPGKLASQAVHAALNAYGIAHGSVVVLQGTKTQTEAMDTVIRDAGLTELPEGSLTAGATLEPVDGYPDHVVQSAWYTETPTGETLWWATEQRARENQGAGKLLKQVSLIFPPEEVPYA